MVATLLTAVLLQQAVLVAAEPSQVPTQSLRRAPLAALSMQKEESFEGSLSSEEASLLSRMDQVANSTDIIYNFEHMEAIGKSLESLIARNRSSEVTSRFLAHMKFQVHALQSNIPNRVSISQTHLDAVLKSFYKCDAERITALSFAERHETDTPEKDKYHTDCRSQEATAKQALDSCQKAKADLVRFMGEDTTCAAWPGLKAMTPETGAAHCKQAGVDETYEDYLERLRNELDSELLVFRQTKAACAGRESAEKVSCNLEQIAYSQKKEICDVLQAHLEKESCFHATEVRNAWNSYSRCWTGANTKYRAEAAHGYELQQAQEKEYLSSLKIECLLKGFSSDNPKKVKEECDQEVAKARVPESLRISIVCPPEYKNAPAELPNYPGSGEYREETFDNIPLKAPVVQSLKCGIMPLVKVSEEDQKLVECQMLEL